MVLVAATMHRRTSLQFIAGNLNSQQYVDEDATIPKADWTGSSVPRPKTTMPDRTLDALLMVLCG